ncbi:MAG: glycoside hydrolase family 127 protein [Eubacteriales bacterium]|nr:glycoside hydrolase family 127 protein [Eubacteriales bacterium]MDY2602155.1 glycoside hydrolase family 127 protein [Eubacteriales bacterium]
MGKYAVEYRINKPMGGVQLTGGALKDAFENNVNFLKKFDMDRMLYWYRVHKGKPAPGVPYAGDAGHFENNLKGQTAGEFMMGAGTALLWREDETLRAMVQGLIAEMDECRDEDGFIIPIPREQFDTKEYPNYTRAWITFGLLDAGYAGESRAFELARDMADYFNHSNVLPYVKDLNLGFQGILANTRMYDAPNGKWEDMQVAIDHYQETWWLKQVIAGDHRAIYDHPGNHPHSTLLTTLEGYLDLYRATGEAIYIDAVKSALHMYEDKWQHVGGGINMCEFDTYWPGCNWLSPKHSYNELCSTNFWILLNQRMHLLFPDEAHYVDEMENSIYNVLLAAQVGDVGYHYLNFLERTKDYRYLDRATCCASLGTRLAGLLPQFVYSYAENDVYVDLFAQSRAELPNGVTLRTETNMPEDGHVKIVIEKAEHPVKLHVRIPRWSVKDGKSYYEIHSDVKAGDVFEYDFAFSLKTTKYSGGEELVGKERWAVEYGPLLYAAMGAPNPVSVAFDPEKPEKWFTKNGKKLILKGDTRHEYWAYKNIHDEPFSVYPVVEKP